MSIFDYDFVMYVVDILFVRSAFDVYDDVVIIFFTEVYIFPVDVGEFYSVFHVGSIVTVSFIYCVYTVSSAVHICVGTIISR